VSVPILFNELNSVVQLLLSYGPFYKKRDNLRSTPKKKMYKTIDSQDLKLKKADK